MTATAGAILGLGVAAVADRARHATAVVAAQVPIATSGHRSVGTDQPSKNRVRIVKPNQYA